MRVIAFIRLVVAITVVYVDTDADGVVATFYTVVDNVDTLSMRMRDACMGLVPTLPLLFMFSVWFDLMWLLVLSGTLVVLLY